MSLVGFHRFLIVCAIVFCLGFAGWELRSYLDAGTTGGSPVLAGVFAVLGAALLVYLLRLRSILKLEE